MADPALRLATNVEGNFFVDETCIDCDACRQLAPGLFARRRSQSAVVRQPSDEPELLRAGKALVSCPTSSIGTIERIALQPAVEGLPERVAGDVYRCGFTSEKSFGAFSYLIASGKGGYLVDSPRFSRPLLRNIQRLGNVEKMLLTHRDDVAEHRKWAETLGCDRVLHARDVTRDTDEVELQPAGDDPVELGAGLVMIPTPGHTRGHAVYLYESRFLFSGDHLAWNPKREELTAFRGVCWYDWDEQIRSMERLLELSFEWVLPGHGRPVRLEPPRMRDALVRLIARMRQQ